MAKIVQKSKKVSIIWSDRAKTDLQEIIHFIQQNSPDAARKLAIQFNEKISRLEFFPDSGRTLPEFPNLPYRECLVGSYRVIYIHKTGTINILTVRHSKRLLNQEDL